MNKQYLCRNGKKSIAQARKLIRSVTASPEAMEQTIELYSDQDVICKHNRFYDVYYVRSSFSPIRYYVVIWNKERNAHECTCHQKCNFHKHTRMVNEFIQSQKNVVA